MPERLSNIIWLYRALALSGVVLLAACGGVNKPTALPPSDQGYLLTVPIASSDSPESLAGRYGGEVIAWLDDQAILKLSNQAAAALSGRGVSLQNTTLQPNSQVRAPVTAQGFNSWAGGFNSWAGGWNSWAGGWNSWAGGNTLPTLPSDNRAFFMISHLIEAHTMSRNFGSGIKVAVIDTGLDLSHPMFNGRLAPNNEWRDFVDGDSNPQEVSGTAYGHGTAAAGIIVQYAPKATLLPLRVLGADGTGDVSRIISAVDWAIQRGVRVINLSLGTNVDVSALRTILESATSRGIYVVASAGNEGNTTTLTWPAQYAKTIAGSQYLISVGSAIGGGTFSSFSNRGTALEAVMLGEGIATSYPDNRVARVIGTSFAAPQVAGTLALMLSETGAANQASLQQAIFNSGWSLGNAEFVHVMSLFSSLSDFPRTRTALFVVGSTALNTADQAVQDMLWRMGYWITTRTGAASTTANANGTSVVVISSSVTAADVNTKFRNVAVPVVTWEHLLYDDLGMVTSEANTSVASNQINFSLLPTTHPLGAGLNLTSMAYSSQAYTAAGGMAAAIPLSSAIRVANLASDPNRAVVFGYNQGAQLHGLNAPARRVALHFHDATATNALHYWTSEWLFAAAITWAVSGN